MPEISSEDSSSKRLVRSRAVLGRKEFPTWRVMTGETGRNRIYFSLLLLVCDNPEIRLSG